MERSSQPITITQVASIAHPLFQKALDGLAQFFAEDEYVLATHDLRANVGTFLGSAGAMLAVMTYKDEVIGFVTVTIMPMIEWGVIAEIGDLWVAKPYRSQGNASQLVRFAENWIASKGCRSLYVTLTKSGLVDNGLDRFYARLGFADLGRISMYKSLPASS